MFQSVRPALPKLRRPRQRRPHASAAAAPSWRRSPLIRAFRRPITWWVLVVIMAVLTAVMLNRASAEADALVAAWGETKSVLVADQIIEVGDDLLSRSQWREFPAAMTPAGAVTEPGAVNEGTVAIARIHPGEVVLRPRISGGGESAGVPRGSVGDGAGAELNAAGAMLPAGTGAVGLRRTDDWPQVVVGDRLNLLATFNPSGDAPATTTLVATGAVVMLADDQTVSVAVPDDDLPATVHALNLASVTAVLVGS